MTNEKQRRTSIRGAYTSLVKSERADYTVEEKIFKLQDQLLTGPLTQEKVRALIKTFNKFKNLAEQLPDYPSNDADKNSHLGSQSRTLERAFLKEGDQAPDFSLINAKGERRSLKDYLKKGKVILSFFRGGWCPYCYLELRAFQKLQVVFRKYGAQVVAISSERPDYCLNTVERNGLEFDVLSDNGNKVAQAYNLVFKSQSDIDLWTELGLNQAISSGNISYELPIPATYIIDEWSTVRYAYTNPDYRKRARPQDLIDCLKELRVLDNGTGL